VFEAKELDKNNWVIDFGSLDELKAALEEQFDHKLVVAYDDPMGEHLRELGDALNVADVRFVEAVGCEAFAMQAYNTAFQLLRDRGDLARVRIVSCECREHGANSAIYEPE
jgi:6-pyruvoyltetrahydropterin/6-carboxytetrahydropterin synthase